MQIRTATDADQPAWDDYVLNHPEGLAYQLFAWQRAVKKAYGYDACYLLAEKENKTCGVLPLIDFRIPFFGSSLISLPYCDAGGILADDVDVAQKLLERALSLAQQSWAKCHIRTTQPLPVDCNNVADKVRMLLDLPDNSEQLLAGLKAKLRSQVKKPVRDGLTVKLGGAELIDQFYTVFAENMRDLGSPVHSRHWIESIVETYGESARVAVVYTPDGAPAAAGIILLHPTTVSIPWASALRKYNRMNPNMLLYWTFLAFAADNGYPRFDFGRSTPGEGTYRFKEQWGANPRQLFWYDLPTATGSGKDVSAERSTSVLSGKRQLVANLWQRLPVAATNTLGPYLRRYISL